jgi:probable phosphoglycerate mutase
MTHLYLIRHGDYRDVENGIFTDGPLTPRGVAQVERLRDRLAATGEIAADVLLASTLQRARQSAAILAPALGRPVALDADLEEWRNEDGTIGPEEFFALVRQTPVEQQPFLELRPGMETRAAFHLRAVAALHRIATAHADQRVAVVCHGGVVEASFFLFFGLSPFRFPDVYLPAENASITHWYLGQPDGLPRRWSLGRYNDAAHLADMPELDAPEP